MKIVVLLTWFLRDKLSFETLNKNFKNLKGDYLFLIADQDWTTDKERELSNEQIKYYQVPYDCGLSYSRNFLVEKAIELGYNYCLLMADSQYFDYTPDFTKVINFLEQSNNRGLVGFKLKGEKQIAWVWDLELVAGKGFKISPPSRQKFNEGLTIFQPCDVTKNFFLAKCKCLQEVKWDENLKLSEHEDWAYRVKQSGWKVFYTDYIQAKYVRNRTGEYDKMRKRCYKEFQDKLKKKYGIRDWIIR